MYEVSGWTNNSEIRNQLVILEVISCRASYYFSLIEKLRNQRKGLTNIQNKVNEWFKSFLVRYLKLLNKNYVNIRDFDGEFTKQLVFKSVKYHVY